MAISRGCSRLMLVNRKTREYYRRGFYRRPGWQEREGLPTSCCCCRQKVSDAAAQETAWTGLAKAFFVNRA